MIRWKIEEERVTVIKARMNKNCSDDSGSIEMKCIADATKITNMKESGCGDCRDVVRQRVESKMTPRLRAAEAGGRETSGDI